MDHSYFSWAFVPRNVNMLDALTIPFTIWFCKIKQSRALRVQHLSVCYLAGSMFHPKQSSSPLDANQPVAALHPVFFTPHVSQVLHKRDCYLGMFFSAALSQSPVTLLDFWVTRLML